MLRRLLPTLLLATVGFLALVVGLVGLQGIFASERDEARENLEGRRRALAEYAHQLLREALDRQVAARRGAEAEALADPLKPGDDLIHMDRGQVLLPRPVRFAPGTGTPAQALYRQLKQLRRLPGEGDPEEPRDARLRLYLRFRGALVLGRRGSISETFRDLLAHRARYVVATTWDLPFMVALLEELSAYSRPDPALMRMLLRDGLPVGPAGRMEGLQLRLLRQRHRFTAPDFAFLTARLGALAEQHRVPREDFLREAGRRPGGVPPLPPVLHRPTVLAGGTWYVVPREGGLRGIRVNPDRDLAAIQRRMVQLKLIATGDVVRGPDWRDAVAIDQVPITVRSPVWSRQRAAIEGRYRIKTGLGVLCGLLALVVVIGALLFQWRRQRYLELKSDFLASVSHELRTPLASIRLLAETLERRAGEAPGARSYPQRILRDAEGLSFLVENLLSFNRLDKGRWVTRPAPVPLGEVVADLEDDLQHVAAQGLELEAEGVEDVTLSADPELLRLLFHNLGRNACLYNEREPVRLRLTAARDRRGLLLQIADNGVGIPPEAWERVFGEFQRVTDGPRGRVRGSGLGLAMCRRIMTLHGGTIRVAASGPEGTTFALRFPGRAILEGGEP